MTLLGLRVGIYLYFLVHIFEIQIINSDVGTCTEKGHWPLRV